MSVNVSETVIISVCSVIIGLVGFLIKTIVTSFSNDLKSVENSLAKAVNEIKENIAKITVTLAINSHAVSDMKEEIRDIRSRE